LGKKRGAGGRPERKIVKKNTLEFTLKEGLVKQEKQEKTKDRDRK
jgi:hypothetical protein